MSTNFDVIVIFPIYGQFGTIQKPDSGRTVCETYIFIRTSKEPTLIRVNIGKHFFLEVSF